MPGLLLLPGPYREVGSQGQSMAGGFLEGAPGCSLEEPAEKQWENRPEPGRAQPGPPEEPQGRRCASSTGAAGSCALFQVLLLLVC